MSHGKDNTDVNTEIKQILALSDKDFIFFLIKTLEW